MAPLPHRFPLTTPPGATSKTDVLVLSKTELLVTSRRDPSVNAAITFSGTFSPTFDSIIFFGVTSSDTSLGSSGPKRAALPYPPHKSGIVRGIHLEPHPAYMGHLPGGFQHDQALLRDCEVHPPSAARINDRLVVILRAKRKQRKLKAPPPAELAMTSSRRAAVSI